MVDAIGFLDLQANDFRRADSNEDGKLDAPATANRRRGGIVDMREDVKDKAEDEEFGELRKAERTNKEKLESHRDLPLRDDDINSEKNDG